MKNNKTIDSDPDSTQHTGASLDIRGNGAILALNDGSVGVRKVENVQVSGYVVLNIRNTSYMLFSNVNFGDNAILDMSCDCDKIAFINCNFNNSTVNIISKNDEWSTNHAPEVLIMGCDTEGIIDNVVRYDMGTYLPSKLWIAKESVLSSEMPAIQEYLEDRLLATDSYDNVFLPEIKSDDEGWGTSIVVLGLAAVASILFSSNNSKGLLESPTDKDKVVADESRKVNSE